MQLFSATRLRLLALCMPLFFSASALAESRAITELPLQALGDDRWQLPAGDYFGQFHIESSLSLECAPGARIDAQGKGHALLIKAPQVRVQGCTLENWGHDLTQMDSAIFVGRGADGSVIRGNQIRGRGFGIWLDGNRDVQVLDNQITGDASVRSQDRGNGIHLFSVKGARILGNTVREARDGIYIDTSHGNHLENNLLEDLRYGVHYMFANDNTVISNITRRTRTGFALMSSRNLTVVGNRSEFDQNYGILMNYITYSRIYDNYVSDVQSGSTDGDSMISGAEGKALFIYNTLFNDIRGNHFQRSGLGIHLTAGSEDNRITLNSFIDNQQQVKYVAMRTQEWSIDGRGNYWSDYLGWDRNGDGLGDVPYEPNDNVDRLLWMYPQVRLLMNSPSIEMLRWVQRAFPVMKSPGVQDSHPLMRMPTEKLLPAAKETRP